MIGPTNAHALKGLTVIWTPPGPKSGIYRGVSNTKRAVCEAINAHQKAGASMMLGVSAAEHSTLTTKLRPSPLDSPTTFVHLELRFLLCVCPALASKIYTMRLDWTDLMPSLRREWERLVLIRSTLISDLMSHDHLVAHQVIHHAVLMDQMIEKLGSLLEDEGYPVGKGMLEV